MYIWECFKYFNAKSFIPVGLRLTLEHPLFLSTKLTWICVWGMCQYFVLPLKNFPEYGVSTNMSYLQKPVTQEQLYYRSYKTYSRNLLSSKSFWFSLTFLLQTPPGLLAITLSHFCNWLWGATRGLILKERWFLKDTGCQGQIASVER